MAINDPALAACDSRNTPCAALIEDPNCLD